MSKKHFIGLAAALKLGRPIVSGVANPNVKASQDVHTQQWRQMVEAIAEVCDRSNGQFDRDRFLEACGYSE